mgnify:CR=1 FL=1
MSPPIPHVEIRTDDTTIFSDLSPDSGGTSKKQSSESSSLIMEQMIIDYHQKDLMLQQVVSGLSSRLHQSQLQVQQLSECLVIATTRNNQPSSVVEADPVDSNDDAIWEAVIQREEDRMNQDEAYDEAAFRAAVLAQEAADNNEEGEVLSTRTHTLVHNSHLQRYKNGLTNFRKVMDQVSGSSKYKGTVLGRRLYGAAAALNPQSSLKNLEVTTSLVHAALLADAGIGGQYANIAKNVPSATTFKECVIDAATDSTFITAEEIITEGARLFLLCDKGAKKTSNSHFVKLLCWWCKAEKTVKTFNLDANDTDGTSEKCAKAIRHALLKMFGTNDNLAIVLHGQATDSGGGGTGYHFLKQLAIQQLTCELEEYLTAFCTLHCLQLTLSNPIQHVLGEGGKDDKGEYKCNAMQALHGVANLQKYHEASEWKNMWGIAAERSGIDISGKGSSWRVPAPVLTRWWTVGECAAYLLKWLPLVLAICHGVIQRDQTKIAANQIASGLQALLLTDVIISDIHLINAYHCYFLCKHFAWLQRGDPSIGNKPGFLNRHLCVRYYLMLEDLTNAWENEGWKRLDAFEDFRQSMVQLSEQQKLEQTMKANHFLEFARNALVTHFKIWVNDLLFLSLYSEQRTAHIVAKYLYDPSASALCDPNDSPINTPQVQLEEYDSPMHKRTINLPRFKAFLEENCVRREQIRANIHVRPHRVTIEVLATTNQDIWSNTAPPLLTAFRENYCQKYAALPSNTHRAESTIKDANHSQIKCREEVLCSTYATARSGIVENLNTSCNKALQERTNIKGNHTVTGGVFGGRKRKYDGSAYEEKEFQQRVDGHVRSEEAIKFVIRRHTKIDNVLTGSVVKKKKWEDLKINLSANAKQFVVERVGEKVSDYETNFCNNKPANALQRRTGLAPLMAGVLTGQLPFRKLLKERDLEQVKMELRYRGLSDEGPWQKGLIERWKVAEGNNRLFTTKCPDVNFEFIRLAKKGDEDEEA